MKKTRSFVIVLVIVMILNLLPQSMVRFGGTVEVAANAPLTLAQLREKFPDGKYWNHAGNPGTENYKNNQDGYTSIPCNHNNRTDTCNAFMPNSTQLSWQCMGYAEKLGYDSTGYNPRDNANGWNTYYNSSALDNLKAGDIVQYWNSEWNCYHSIFVIKVNGETVTYTDCNWGGTCQIRWDVTTSKSWLRERFVGGSHVRSSPGINIDNGNMTIPTIKTDSKVYKTDSTVHISWEKTSRDTDFYQYWLIVKNESTKKEVYGGDAGSTGNVDKNYYDIKLTGGGEYKITVYSVPHNDKETRQAVATSTIKVGDLGQMTTPTIRLDQKVYQPNNTIHITWDKTSANTDFYQYWLIIRNSETKEEIYGGDAGSTGNVDRNYYDLTINKAGMYEITLYSVPYNDKETRQKSATALFTVGFTDVKESAWYYDYVKEVYELGLMNGIGVNSTTFAPGKPMTRAMVTTVLYRMAGNPEITYEEKFPDVTDGHYYSVPVTWAANHGIVDGYGDGKFRVSAAVTREQLVKMLYSYAEMLGLDTSARADLTTYQDGTQISKYAKEPMSWAIASGILSGTGKGELKAKSETTRAEVAKMLVNFYQLIEK